MSIDTRPGTETLEQKFSAHPQGPGQQSITKTGCEPGPDADLEALVLPEDKVSPTTQKGS